MVAFELVKEGSWTVYVFVTDGDAVHVSRWNGSDVEATTKLPVARGRARWSSLRKDGFARGRQFEVQSGYAGLAQ